jgi:hypothetical protein
MSLCTDLCCKTHVDVFMLTETFTISDSQLSSCGGIFVALLPAEAEPTLCFMILHNDTCMSVIIEY